MNQSPKVLMLAGPNGAGKTTLARQFLPNEAQCPSFINADLIAAGLAPLEPETVAVRAGRLMLEEINERVRNRKSFAIETTLSGRAYVNKIKEWQELGYRVKLIFLSLPTADLDVARVAARVSQGGHHIPEDVIRRRFDSGLDNLEKLYQNLVDAWIVYDNSGVEPRLVKWGQKPHIDGHLPTDPDLVSVDQAFKRAAKYALSFARRTETPCYILRDGSIVDISGAQEKMELRQDIRTSLSQLENGEGVETEQAKAIVMERVGKSK